MIGGIAAAGGALAELVSGYDVVSKPARQVATTIHDRFVAWRISGDARRDEYARRLLAATPSGEWSCFENALQFDLDADGIAADLVVLFHRTATPGDCSSAAGTPLDAAFFHAGWGGYRFVGTPNLPAANTVWAFAGPAAFRLSADGNYPGLNAYMLKGERMTLIDKFDTTAFRDFRNPDFLTTDGGRIGWVTTQVSLIKSGFDGDGQPYAREMMAEDVITLGTNAHFLSSRPGEGLLFDGRADQFGRPTEADLTQPDYPSPDDERSVAISPGESIYIVGCEPVRGVRPIERAPRAFLVDLNDSPIISCPTGEENHFTVYVVEKDF